MNPQDRAKAAYAAAEAAEHPADKSALRAAARAWERIAGGGTPWSLDPARRELAALKREVAAATGPCQPPKRLTQEQLIGTPAQRAQIAENWGNAVGDALRSAATIEF